MQRPMRIPLALGLLLTFGWAFQVHAESMAIPASLQTAIFKKVISFDATVPDPKAVTLLVVHSEPGGTECKGILAAFSEAGFSPKACAPGDAAAQAAGAKLAYLGPGAAGASRALAGKGLLILSGVPAHVSAGQAAVGVTEEAGKPRILVNKGALDASGHKLSSKVLELAKIVS